MEGKPLNKPRFRSHTKTKVVRGRQITKNHGFGVIPKQRLSVEGKSQKTTVSESYQNKGCPWKANHKKPRFRSHTKTKAVRGRQITKNHGFGVIPKQRLSVEGKSQKPRFRSHTKTKAVRGRQITKNHGFGVIPKQRLSGEVC